MSEPEILREKKMLSLRDICAIHFTLTDFIRFSQTVSRLKKIQTVLNYDSRSYEPVFKHDFETMLDTMQQIDLQLRDIFSDKLG